MLFPPAPAIAARRGVSVRRRGVPLVMLGRCAVRRVGKIGPRVHFRLGRGKGIATSGCPGGAADVTIRTREQAGRLQRRPFARIGRAHSAFGGGGAGPGVSTLFCCFEVIPDLSRGKLGYAWAVCTVEVSDLDSLSRMGQHNNLGCSCLRGKAIKRKISLGGCLSSTNPLFLAMEKKSPCAFTPKGEVREDSENEGPCGGRRALAVVVRCHVPVRCHLFHVFKSSRRRNPRGWHICIVLPSTHGHRKVLWRHRFISGEGW